MIWGSPASASPAKRCTLFLSAKLVPGRRILGVDAEMWLGACCCKEGIVKVRAEGQLGTRLAILKWGTRQGAVVGCEWWRFAPIDSAVSQICHWNHATHCMHSLLIGCGQPTCPCLCSYMFDSAGSYSDAAG